MSGVSNGEEAMRVGWELRKPRAHGYPLLVRIDGAEALPWLD